jgi:hypothetical protein
MTEILEQNIKINESGSFDVMDYVPTDAHDNAHYLFEFDSAETANEAKRVLNSKGFQASIYPPKEVKVYHTGLDPMETGKDLVPQISNCLKNAGMKQMS